MIELSNCPACGSEMKVYPCGSYNEMKYRAYCHVCPFTWKVANSEDEAIRELNDLCEWIRVGKAMKQLVDIHPEGWEFTGVPRFNLGLRAEKTENYIRWRVVLKEPVPAPVTKDDVLRRCREMLRHWKPNLPEGLLSDIDAVLENDNGKA